MRFLLKTFLKRFENKQKINSRLNKKIDSLRQMVVIREHILRGKFIYIQF